jgi:hypothetical protein
MTALERKALASVALSKKTVSDIFDSASMMTREKAIEVLERLCVSHERLRAELIGAETMIDEMATNETKK